MVRRGACAAFRTFAGETKSRIRRPWDTFVKRGAVLFSGGRTRARPGPRYLEIVTTVRGMVLQRG